MKLATVSIVSHRHAPMVAELLGDLRKQTIAGQLSVVLTLNLDEATPNPEIYDGIDLQIIRNPRPKGFGANHNSALTAAQTPWVFVVNPDIRVPDEMLFEKLLRTSTEGLGLVAPLIVNSHNEREDSVRANIDPVSILRRRMRAQGAAGERDALSGGFFWIAGMFMGLPLTAWRAVGGFDERFFLYCEDYDLCARLVAQGYRLQVLESAHAIHDAQRSSRKSLRYMRWHIASLLKVWSSSYFWRIWARDLRNRAR